MDAGTDPESTDGFGLEPKYEYVHPAKGEHRPTNGIIDIGAYEYAP